MKTMLKKMLMLIAVTSALTAAIRPAAAQEGRSFDTDFQIWNDTQFVVPIAKEKGWDLILQTFGRFGDRVQTTTDARLGIILTKKINKYASVGGGYQYRYSNPTFRQSRYESRYLGQVIFNVPLDQKWALVNRNLVQYESRYSRPDATVTRNRLWLKREVTVAKNKIEPFVSFETFYDTRLKGFARYRTQTGFSRRFNEKFSADFYYVRQDETGGRTRPGTLNGIGTSFRVNF